MISSNRARRLAAPAVAGAIGLGILTGCSQAPEPQGPPPPVPGQGQPSNAAGQPARGSPVPVRRASPGPAARRARSPGVAVPGAPVRPAGRPRTAPGARGCRWCGCRRFGLGWRGQPDPVRWCRHRGRLDLGRRARRPDRRRRARAGGCRRAGRDRGPPPSRGLRRGLGRGRTRQYPTTPHTARCAGSSAAGAPRPREGHVRQARRRVDHAHRAPRVGRRPRRARVERQPAHLA